MKQAFTLVELLVVISIIALLLGMLMPALKRAREKGRQVVCMSHLRQIGVAEKLYASDYRDLYPDANTVGGFGFRAAPGYKNPKDPRGLAEKYGLAAVLGKSDYNGKSPATAYIDGKSKVWICAAQPCTWMQDLGNTYAFSIAEMLTYTRTYDSKRTRVVSGSIANTGVDLSTQPLIWDNFTYLPYTPGMRAPRGDVAGFTIPPDQRIYPHKFRDKNAQSANYLYMDGHADEACNQ